MLCLQIFQITLNLILTFICITLVSSVICILMPLRLLRDPNPSVIMDRVYGTVCHMKLNLKKKLFLHSQGNLNAMLTSSVICLILLFSLFCFMYIATHITIVLKLLLCCFCSRPTLLNIVSKIWPGTTILLQRFLSLL